MGYHAEIDRSGREVAFRWCPPFRVLQIVSGLDERKLVLGRGPASSYNTRMKRTRLDLS